MLSPNVTRARTATSEKGSIQSDGRVLNRIVSWTTDGWEVEPDQRHVDLIVQEMGMKDAKPVSTPGERADKDSDEANEELEENKHLDSDRWQLDPIILRRTARTLCTQSKTSAEVWPNPWKRKW